MPCRGKVAVAPIDFFEGHHLSCGLMADRVRTCIFLHMQSRLTSVSFTVATYDLMTCSGPDSSQTFTLVTQAIVVHIFSAVDFCESRSSARKKVAASYSCPPHLVKLPTQENEQLLKRTSKPMQKKITLGLLSFQAGKASVREWILFAKGVKRCELVPTNK